MIISYFSGKSSTIETGKLFNHNKPCFRNTFISLFVFQCGTSTLCIATKLWTVLRIHLKLFYDQIFKMIHFVIVIEFAFLCSIKICEEKYMVLFVKHKLPLICYTTKIFSKFCLYE